MNFTDETEILKEKFDELLFNDGCDDDEFGTQEKEYQREFNKIQKEANKLKSSISKEYRECKREHCDICDDKECDTCKPEFDELRDALDICNHIIAHDANCVEGEQDA